MAMSTSTLPIAVIEGERAVLLSLGAEVDGGASFVPGRPDAALDFRWQAVVVPGGDAATAEIAEPNASRTRVAFTEPGLYVLRLDVFEDGRRGQPAYVELRAVRGALIARAEADPPDPEIGRTVRLVGYAEVIGPVPGEIAFTWTQLSPGAHPVSLASPNAAQTTFVAPSTPARLAFGLEVSAAGLVSEMAVVEVDVHAGDIDLEQSDFDVQPRVHVADGAGTLTVSAILRDESGNTLPGRDVSFTTTAGTLLGVPMEDAEGAFTQLLQAPTEVGEALVGLVVDGVGAGSPIPVAFVPGPPDHVRFLVQPTEVRAGDPIAPAVSVGVFDAHGNVPEDSVTVTVSLQGDASLGGTRNRASEAGLAIFDDLWVSAPGTYGLVASAPNVDPDTSDPFVVTPGPDWRLVFTAQPGDGNADAPIPGPIELEVLDAFDNRVTEFDGTVTLSLAGGQLTGQTQVAASGGVVAFTEVYARQAGTFELNAAATGVLPAASEPFTVIHGAAHALEFVDGPSSTVSMAAMAPPVRVATLDAHGNPVLSGASAVTVALIDGDTSATLYGTAQRASVDGVASFDDLAVDVAASGYRLVADDGTLDPVTSATFDVGPGPPDHIVFGTQPGDIRAGESLDRITLVVRDAQGNVVTDHTGGVSIELDAPLQPTAALVGTTAASFEGGEAHFDGLTVHRAGEGYALVASTSSQGQAQSEGFDVGPAEPFYLFVASPSYALYETVCSLPVTVRVYDFYENPTWFDGVTQLELTALEDRVAFYSDDQCANAVTNVPFQPGSSEALFYFAGTQPGEAILSVAVAGISGTSQSHTILEVPPLEVAVAPESVSAMVWDTVSLSAEATGGLGSYAWQWEVVSETVAGAGGFAAEPGDFDQRASSIDLSDTLFFPSRAGTYILRATVEDDRGVSGFEEVTVTVAAATRVAHPGTWGAARRESRHLAVDPVTGHVGIATRSRGAVYRPGENDWHYLDCLPGLTAREGWTMISGLLGDGSRRFFWSSINDHRIARLNTYVSCDETRANTRDDLPGNPDYVTDHAQSPDGRIWITTEHDVTTVSPDSMSPSGHYWFASAGLNRRYDAVGFSPGGSMVLAPNDGGYFLVDPDDIGTNDTAPRHHLSAAEPGVVAVTAGHQGAGVDEVWLSTLGEGLWRIPDATAGLSAVRYDPSFAFQSDEDWGRGVYEAGTGDVWFVTGAGLARYKRDVDRVVGIPLHVDGLCHDGEAQGPVWSVAIDEGTSRGRRMWLGCHDGLFRMVP
jgi:hypothetical protein